MQDVTEMLFLLPVWVETKVAKDIKHMAVVSIGWRRKTAGSPPLTAGPSCLFAWQVLTLRCLYSLIINTAVLFGLGPEVVCRG